MAEPTRGDRTNRDIEHVPGPIGSEGGSEDEIWDAPTQPDRSIQSTPDDIGSRRRADRDGEREPERPETDSLDETR